MNRGNVCLYEGLIPQLFVVENTQSASKFRIPSIRRLDSIFVPFSMHLVRHQMPFDVLMLTFDSLLAPISGYLFPFSENFYKSLYQLWHSRKLLAKSIRNSLALLGRYMILQSQSSTGFSHHCHLVFSFFCLRGYFTLLWGYGLKNMPIRMMTSRLQCELLTVTSGYE